MLLKEILSKIELTPSQSEILEFLYKNKEARASEIAKKIGRSRTIVYTECEELAIWGLVKKIERPNRVTVFTAEHPSLLKNRLADKEKRLKEDKKLLNDSLPDIIASYNLLNNRPGVRFYEGVDGLKEIYEEILSERKDFYLIRTSYEPVYDNKIAPIVEDFIENRIKKNIKVTAIIPSVVNDPKKDARWLMERFNVSPDMYTSPVEIDIFGDKVAILSFGEDLIGMIIDSKQIAQSLKQLFSLATFASNMKKCKR